MREKLPPGIALRSWAGSQHCWRRQLRWWLRGSLLVLLLGGSVVTAHASVIMALPLDKPNPLSAKELGRTAEGVRITVTERALSEVLQGIQRASGIRFEVVSHLMNKPLTVSIDAPNWTLAVQQLLIGFKRLEIMDGRQRLRRVIIGGYGTTGALPPIRGPHVREVEGQPLAEPAGVPGTSAGMAGRPGSWPPEDPGLQSEDPGTSDAPPGVVLSPPLSPGPPLKSELTPGSGPPGVSHPSDVPPPGQSVVAPPSPPDH